jgi:sulfate adenylyltransferase subunit 1
VSYIPLSALTGDNVVESLGGMPWYQGQTILEHLEVRPAMLRKGKAFPSSNRNPTKTEEYHDFRGYAGKLYGNNIKGDVVTVLPSLTESVVTNIHFFDKQFEEAAVGFDYQIRNDINVTRGDMIVKSSELPK